MKLALILPGFSAAEDDWCIPALLDLTRALTAGGAEVHVFPLRYPQRRDAYIVARARVHPQGGGTSGGAARLPLLTRALRAVVAEHRRGPFDILHAFWADEPGFLAVTAAALLRLPAVVSLAGGELAGFPDLGYGGQLHRLSRTLTRLALTRAAAVTAGSPYLASLAREQRVHRPVRVMPLGVDTSLFGPGAAVPLGPPGAFNLLQVGSLVPVKEHAIAIRALAIFAATVPNARLHLVGEGPLRCRLEQQATSLGLHGNVTFHGDVPHHELPRYYRAADACLLTSRHEAQGLVLLEAAACGVPTAGSGVGLLPTLFPALAVSPGDPAALADRLIRLATDPALRDLLGSEARATVERDYSLEATERSWCALYAELAGRRRSALPAGSQG